MIIVSNRNKYINNSNDPDTGVKRLNKQSLNFQKLSIVRFYFSPNRTMVNSL